MKLMILLTPPVHKPDLFSAFTQYFNMNPNTNNAAHDTAQVISCQLLTTEFHV
jgi:hypothetical protein